MGGSSKLTFPHTMETVQTFGRKREAVAVAFVKKGKGLIKINGVPIELVQPETLRFKVWEPVLLLGANRYRGLTSGFASRVVVTLPRSMPSARPLPRLSLPGTRNTSMRPRSVRSRRF